MPKGYVIFTEKVSDPEGLAAYSAAAVPSVIAAGGTAIIAGPSHLVAEGKWHGEVTVVLEFESVAAAKAWYTGPDYQAVIEQRHKAASSNVAIFEGFTPPSLEQ